MSKFDGSASEVTLGTEITAPGTVVAGSPLNIRVEANGVSPTTVQARVWTGATEPATWAVTTTDSSAALQASGSVGVRGTLSSSVTNGPIVGSVARFTAIAD